MYFGLIMYVRMYAVDICYLFHTRMCIELLPEIFTFNPFLQYVDVFVS